LFRSSFSSSGRVGGRRNQGASLQASGASARDCGPSGGAKLAEVNDRTTAATWQDSAGPTGPQSQVSDHSNLGFSGFGRRNKNCHNLGRSRGRGGKFCSVSVERRAKNLGKCL